MTTASKTNKNSTPYEALLAIVTALALVYWFTELRIFLNIALALALAGLLVKAVARGVDWLWQTLTRAIGWVSSRLLLGAVFFLFLTPIAWLYRRFTGDPLKLHRQKDSYFFVREHEFEGKDLRHPW